MTPRLWDLMNSLQKQEPDHKTPRFSRSLVRRVLGAAAFALFFAPWFSNPRLTVPELVADVLPGLIRDPIAYTDLPRLSFASAAYRQSALLLIAVMGAADLALVILPTNMRRHSRCATVTLMSALAAFRVEFTAFGVLFGGYRKPPASAYVLCMCLAAIPLLLGTLSAWSALRERSSAALGFAALGVLINVVGALPLEGSGWGMNTAAIVALVAFWVDFSSSRSVSAEAGSGRS